MIDDEEPPAISGPVAPSLPLLLGVMAALTLVAAMAGAGLGLLLDGTLSKEASSAAKPTTNDMKYAGETSVRELQPVIANLAEPSDAWIRVQASIVFDGKAVQKPEVVAAEIGEDILGFLRTLTIAQIGGASGLQHLREDLNERAFIRSGGLVRELVLQTLVVQ
ncbi:MAG TPA: flagellar basal body-associated FliL family protein [Methylocella sp.]|nr:flagellar basal body-associated FliL family protein [Methylocella sp.]